MNDIKQEEKKEAFESPIIEMIEFTSDDVILSSGEDDWQSLNVDEWE